MPTASDASLMETNLTDTAALPVLICGALGRMGQEAVKTVASDPALSLSAIVDPKLKADSDLQALYNLQNSPSVCRGTDLTSVLAQAPQKPQVGVELTRPDSVFDNTMAMIEAGIAPVVGATGLSEEQIKTINNALISKELPGAIIPNFALGAVLLMQFAKQAARYFENAEIIELHHNQKADAPSGTAILTARLMAEARASQEPKQFGTQNAPEREEWPAARGAIDANSGLRVHSVRLPGLLAHQEVLFGDAGQVLTLRHDSTNRSCFMPGIILAIKTIVKQPPGLIIGLEHLMELN